MKKKPYVKSLILSFMLVFIFAMVLITYMEREQAERKSYEYVDGLLDVVNMTFTINMEGNSYSKEEIEDLILETISSSRRNLEENYSERYSMALYEKSGEFVARTASILTIASKVPNYCYDLDEYFTEEEQMFLRKVYIDREIDKRGVEAHEERPPVWYIHAYVNEKTGELAKLYLTTKFKTKIDEHDYETPNSETKWSWINPNEDVHQNLIKLGDTTHMSYDIFIPYLKISEREYEKWVNHEFLQDYSDTWEDSYLGSYEEDTLFENRRELVFEYFVGDEEYIIKLRYVSQPLLQAIVSLKYVYIISAIFIVLCLWLVIRNLNKFYDRREQLEATRRDFTNAIAHELKTPLGIIRGFAENSLENTNEAKREYYLKQIVGQTEEMDKLVKEMVYISKLDSEGVTLKKESVHLEDVVKSQLKKLETLSDEKNLDIKVNVDDDFTVQGDQAYLERAIWNVLHNAIEYNHLDGFIRITINKKELCIENSGVKLKEDEITHVFDMFYTNDKSRSFSEKHMGLGLYLTKRILELHKINITIGNTDVGVKVKIYM